MERLRQILLLSQPIPENKSMCSMATILIGKAKDFQVPIDARVLTKYNLDQCQNQSIFKVRNIEKYFIDE